MRFAFAGHRPGQTYWTPEGWIETSTIDGGVELSEAQQKYFAGIPMVFSEVSGDAPPSEVDHEALARIAANKKTADKLQAEIQKPATQKKAPK